MKKSLMVFGTLSCLLASDVLLRAEDSLYPRKFEGSSPLRWSQKMADSEVSRLGDKLVWKPQGTAKWDYAAGLFTLSLLKLDEATHQHRYLKFVEQATDSFIGNDGSIHGYNRDDYTLDNLNPGKTVLALYELTREPRYRKAAELLRSQLDSQPRTKDGGFWHKQKYPNQMWLDGAYMAEPFYAQCAMLFHEPESSLEDITKQFQLLETHTYDPGSGLFYHGWDESKQQPWANKETGTSSNFWGRAVGWYGMALVDVLDFMPANYAGRCEAIGTLQKWAGGVISHQDPGSGLWYQVMDQPGRKGNYLESTASSMFDYTLAKGINHGYLTRDYVPQVLRGYEGLVQKMVKPSGLGKVSLIQCCSVAGLGYGRDGSYDYYIKEPVVENDLKGVGPFILAGIELQSLLELSPKD